MTTTNFEKEKNELITGLNKRVEDGIIERSNADLIIKLINNSDSLSEAIQIAELGTTYKRTGFHFDKRLEKIGNTIKYLKRNDELSFSDGSDKPHHKLIIGDNYDALLNLLIEYRGKIDVIYIDPPYGKDSMGEFADTNYNNAITRDNLLSMMYPRLFLAKQLLSPEGVIFCSIDDRNLAYVIDLFSEIFEERRQIFVAPRQTKKGGKTTTTIQKNHDYILCYSMNPNPLFSKEERDEGDFNLVDEFVEERGKYKLTQTLDYNSLSYSEGLDYEIEFEGRTFVPGGDINAYNRRKSGDHQDYDWTWRWSKDAFEWGVKNGFIVLKGDRIYTKTYQKCRKKPGSLEIEKAEGKSYTTLSFLDNENSNDNGKKRLVEIFEDGSKLFDNPKPQALIKNLISLIGMADGYTVLDFFAGSGTTGQAVLELNKERNENNVFILCTNNERTSQNPNGIAYDVTSKRMKRIMTGECYDGSKNFKWRESNEPFGGSLDVYEIDSVANFEQGEGKSPFEVIDETCYGLSKFESVSEKVKWVCQNFENTQKYLEGE